MLLSQEAFEIEPTSGVIKVKSGLSRDSAAEIDFNVIVKDVNAENNKEQTAKGDKHLEHKKHCKLVLFMFKSLKFDDNKQLLLITTSRCFK